MARRKSRTLSQGPFGQQPSGAGGPKPPWWPDWMPWIDVSAWQDIFGRYQEFTTGGRETEITRESVSEAFTGAMDIYEDWLMKARKAIEERMR